jgi:hypothetical protein
LYIGKKEESANFLKRKVIIIFVHKSLYFESASPNFYQLFRRRCLKNQNIGSLDSEGGQAGGRPPDCPDLLLPGVHFMNIHFGQKKFKQFFIPRFRGQNFVPKLLTKIFCTDVLCIVYVELKISRKVDLKNHIYKYTF